MSEFLREKFCDMNFKIVWKYSFHDFAPENNVSCMAKFHEFFCDWNFKSSGIYEFHIIWTFYNTVWKFEDFSATHVSYEINFGESRSSKIAVLAIFGSLDLVLLVNFSLLKMQKFLTYLNSKPWNPWKWFHGKSEWQKNPQISTLCDLKKYTETSYFRQNDYFQSLLSES